MRDFQLRWVFTTILVIIGVLILARLGKWQLDRLEQRRAFNERVETQLNRTPLTLNQETPIEQLYDMEYRTVNIEGNYIPDENLLLRNQVWEGRQGYHLLTPLKIMDSENVVFINRGWIPFEEVNDLSRFQEPEVIAATGMIRRPQTKPDFGGVPDPTLSPGERGLAKWNIINLERVQEQVEYPILPIYIQIAQDDQPMLPPYPSLPELELTEGSHFGYAIQWFTFAAILGLGYPFFVRRQIKRTDTKLDLGERSKSPDINNQVFGHKE